MCGLWTHPWIDTDPPLFLPLSSCHQWGSISSRHPRGNTLLDFSCWSQCTLFSSVLCYCAPVCMYYITVCLETRDQHWSLWTTGLPYTCHYWFVCQEGQQNVLKLFPNILFWRNQFSVSEHNTWKQWQVKHTGLMTTLRTRQHMIHVYTGCSRQIPHVKRIQTTKHTDKMTLKFLSCNALSKQHSDEIRQFCNSNTETNKITFDHTWAISY